MEGHRHEHAISRNTIGDDSRDGVRKAGTPRIFQAKDDAARYRAIGHARDYMIISRRVSEAASAGQSVLQPERYRTMRTSTRVQEFQLLPAGRTKAMAVLHDHGAPRAARGQYEIENGT